MISPAQLQKILKTNKLLESGDRLIVGVSGGPDSVALLCLLCDCGMDINILPVYIDHGLRPLETPQEKKFITELAAKLQLQCKIVVVDTLQNQKEHGYSLEESARFLRYQVLQRCCKEFRAKRIAVAHTADDQAEEVLLRLFRGTGLKGLSGMEMRMANIIRPLLTTPKRDLLDYLEQNKVSYCTDSSNSDRTFLRNRIRLDLLPEISETINPSIRSILLQTADILREDDNYLDDITENTMALCIHQDDKGTPGPSITVDLNLFNKEHIAIQRRMVEKILWFFSSRPSFFHISQILSLAHHGKNGAELHASRGMKVFRSARKLHFLQPHGNIPLRGSLKPVELRPLQIWPDKSYTVEALNKEMSIERLTAPKASLQEGELFLDAKNLVWPLTLRSFRPGERFSPQGMVGRKKVSKFFSDQKIPRIKRYLHPVLLSEEKIVAVLGLRIDNAYAADDSTQDRILIRWQTHDK